MLGQFSELILVVPSRKGKSTPKALGSLDPRKPFHSNAHSARINYDHDLDSNSCTKTVFYFFTCLDERLRLMLFTILVSNYCG
jgi:hypothetical protein